MIKRLLGPNWALPVACGLWRRISVERRPFDIAAARPESCADHFVRIGFLSDGVRALAFRSTPARKPCDSPRPLLHVGQLLTHALHVREILGTLQRQDQQAPPLQRVGGVFRQQLPQPRRQPRRHGQPWGSARRRSGRTNGRLACARRVRMPGHVGGRQGEDAKAGLCRGAQSDPSPM